MMRLGLVTALLGLLAHVAGCCCPCGNNPFGSVLSSTERYFIPNTNGGIVVSTQEAAVREVPVAAPAANAAMAH